MGAPHKNIKVTPKVRAFVEHYLADPNATAAARKAGYKGKQHTLEVQGSYLLRKPEVQKLIAEGQRLATNERIASATEVRELWTRILRDAKQPTIDRLRASALLAKSQGQFLGQEPLSDGGGDTYVFVCPQPIAQAEAWAKAVRAERIATSDE